MADGQVQDDVASYGDLCTRVYSDEQALRLGRTVSLLLGELSRQPVQTLVQALARRRAGRLDLPVALAERVQAQLLGDLGRVHGLGQILRRGGVRDSTRNHMP